ncbi:MAG TPA: DUF1289 domain-containing protein [Stellaceae bacterium]|nr:DUF1289 domain-containing protein [Stellaceae bacterium]
MSERSPVSPCASVCALDPATGLCRGCFRTIDEIARWTTLSAEEKRRVLAAVEERRARLQGGHAPGAPREG